MNGETELKSKYFNFLLTVIICLSDATTQPIEVSNQSNVIFQQTHEIDAWNCCYH